MWLKKKRKPLYIYRRLIDFEAIYENIYRFDLYTTVHFCLFSLILVLIRAAAAAAALTLHSFFFFFRKHHIISFDSYHIQVSSLGIVQISRGNYNSLLQKLKLPTGTEKCYHHISLTTVHEFINLDDQRVKPRLQPDAIAPS